VALHWTLSVLTLGCWWLLCYWYPKVWLSMTAEKTKLHFATHVCQKVRQTHTTSLRASKRARKNEKKRHHSHADMLLGQQGAEGELTPILHHRLLGRHFFWRCEQWHWDDEAAPAKKKHTADHQIVVKGAFVRTLFRSRVRFEELRRLYQSCNGVNRLVRREIFGNNLIDIPLSHPATLFMREVCLFS